MKIRYAITLSVVSGIAIGAGIVKGPQAQRDHRPMSSRNSKSATPRPTKGIWDGGGQVPYRGRRQIRPGVGKPSPSTATSQTHCNHRL